MVKISLKKAHQPELHAICRKSWHGNCIKTDCGNTMVSRGCHSSFYLCTSFSTTKIYIFIVIYIFIENTLVIVTFFGVITSSIGISNVLI